MFPSGFPTRSPVTSLQASDANTSMCQCRKVRGDRQITGDTPPGGVGAKDRGKGSVEPMVRGKAGWAEGPRVYNLTPAFLRLLRPRGGLKHQRFSQMGEAWENRNRLPSLPPVIGDGEACSRNEASESYRKPARSSTIHNMWMIEPR
jgi:hypothetical protein